MIFILPKSGNPVLGHREVNSGFSISIHVFLLSFSYGSGSRTALEISFASFLIFIRSIWHNISQISLFNFFILVGLRVLYWLLRTICWKVILDVYESNSLFNLFKARMAGHSISQLTPTAMVGSEATRIYMADNSNRKVSLASVIVDKTIEFLVVVFFTIIGVSMVLFRISLPVKLKTIFIIGVMIAVFLVLFFVKKQKNGLLGWIINILGKFRIKPKFMDNYKRKIMETDEHISRFYKENKRVFIKTFLLYALLIMLWTTEIHLGLIFIGINDVSFIDNFLITVLGNLAFIFPFIPGSLGIYEATYIGLFAIFGMSASAALTLVLIRRIIALLLAGFGLLGFVGSSNK